MINYRFLTLVFGFLFLRVFDLFGQSGEPRFGAGIIAGLTASQIDGDESAGYNKLGFLAGLRGTARLTERSLLSIEFLYAQRGAQTELIRDEFNPFYFKLTMNYLEIPVQWHYKDWLVEYEDEAENFYRVTVNGGFSYARLLGQSFVDETNIQLIPAIVPDYLRKEDISLLLGASFFATRHLGFTFRWVKSLRPIYNPSDFNPNPWGQTWRPHALYFQTFYMF